MMQDFKIYVFTQILKLIPASDRTEKIVEIICAKCIH